MIKFQIVSSVCLVLLLAADGFAIVDQQFAPAAEISSLVWAPEIHRIGRKRLPLESLENSLGLTFE